MPKHKAVDYPCPGCEAAYTAEPCPEDRVVHCSECGIDFLIPGIAPPEAAPSEPSGRQVETDPVPAPEPEPALPSDAVPPLAPRADLPPPTAPQTNAIPDAVPSDAAIPREPVIPAPEPRTSGLAVAGLVLALLSLPGTAGCGLACLTAVPALILGFLARSEINRSEGRLRGRGIATAAIIISAAVLALSVILVIAAVLLLIVASVTAK